MALEPGQVIDRYSVESVLGQGGMAIVYKVKHAQLHSSHALKVLTISSESIRERLVQEGRLQASLAHPNIVAVTDILDVAGAPGLVMEYITGPSLDDFLRENVPSAAEAERLFRGIVEGVRHAHSLGIVHRDLKPANVMLYTGAGQSIPKVADFGLAKAFAEEGSMGQTRSGMAMGTPAYMSPEQIRDAKNVDERADVFSLGCILYELLAGRPPFEGPDILSIFNAVTSGEYKPVERMVEGAPDHLKACIEGCLQVDRDRRLGSCGDILRVLDGERWEAVVKPLPPSGATLSGEDFFTDEVPRSLPPSGGSPKGDKPLERLPGTMAPDSLGAVESSAGRTTRPSSPSIVSKKVAVAGFGGLLMLGGGAVVLAVAAGAGGWFWLQHSTDQAVRTYVERIAGDDVAIRDVSWTPSGVVIDGMRIRGSDGLPLASVRQLRLVGDVSADALVLDSLLVDGVQYDLRRGGDGWVLPERLRQVVSGGLAHESTTERLLAHRVKVTEVMVKYRGTSGETSARAKDVLVEELRVDTSSSEGWRAARMVVDGLAVQAEQPILKVERLDMPEGGSAVAEGMSLSLALSEQGWVSWPEPLRWEVAQWAGGFRVAAIDAPWFGWNLRALPALPASLAIKAGEVEVVDGVNGGAPKTWTLAMSGGQLGPVEAQRLPFAFEGTLARAPFELHGDLRDDGMVRFQGGVKDLSLAELSPYFQSTESQYGVTLDQGKATADLAWSNLGPSYALSLTGTVDGLRFSEAPGGAKGRASRLLRDKGPNRLRWEDDGDLDERYYAPLNGVFEQLTAAAFDAGGGASWTTGPPTRRRGSSDSGARSAPSTAGTATTSGSSSTPTSSTVSKPSSSAPSSTQGGGISRDSGTSKPTSGGTEPQDPQSEPSGTPNKTRQTAAEAVRAAREILQSGGISRPR